jgi:ornithine cyclodeaminase
MHAHVLPLERIVLWGRDPARVEACRRDIAKFADVSVAAIPAEVAHETRLIVTCTASRAPLLRAGHIQVGTHISAVGSDSPGKQELDPAILSRAGLVLVDSRRQCEKLGELQHAPDAVAHVVELGEFLAETAPSRSRLVGGITVCDFTGLGVEDLYIAEYCWEKLA